MLIGMIGSPNTFKSTLASTIFSDFKQDCINCEFICEYARSYILEKRYNSSLAFNDKVILTDEDQLIISSKQYTIEKYAKEGSSPETIVISDSCYLNSSLYMSTQLQNNYLEDLSSIRDHYDLLFFCHPIDDLRLPENDFNRIHDKEAIERAYQEARRLVNKIKESGFKVIDLMGDFSNRIKEAKSFISKKRYSLITKEPLND